MLSRLPKKTFGNVPLSLQVMNDWLRRSQQHEVGVPFICGLPGDGSGPLWLVFHSTLPNQETPTPASSQICGQEKRKKRVCCWALGPVYRRGSSRVTSHQTLGPLKHIWVAPAVPRAIRILTECREPEQHKNEFSQCEVQLFRECSVFLVKRVKFSLFKRFALNKHSKEG